MSEVAFEKLAIALEATRGTAISAPTVLLNMEGTLTPVKETYTPPDRLGNLAEIGREEEVHAYGEWEAEGDIDFLTLPYILNMWLKAVTSPTTPDGGTNARLWTFPRDMTSDTIKAATIFAGDPNQKILQGAYGMIDEATVSADASSTDGVSLSLKGMTRYPEQLGAVPTFPGIVLSPDVVAGRLAAWIDAENTTTSQHGTTAVTGRIVSAELSFPTGVTYKYVAVGEGTGAITYDHTGRSVSHPELKLSIEYRDQTQYNQYDDGTIVQARVRFNGAKIENVASEVQTLTVSGTPTTGTWIPAGVHPVTGTTRSGAAIAVDASAATVQTSLEGIFGTGNVSVARTGSSPNYVYTATFQGDLAGVGVAQMTATDTFDGAALVTPGTTTNGSAYYNYLQFDITGKMESFAWGTLEDSNRTMEVTIKGKYDGSNLMGTDLVGYVQCTKTAL